MYSTNIKNFSKVVRYLGGNISLLKNNVHLLCDLHLLSV